MFNFVQLSRMVAFYLSSETLDLLEDKLHQLRKLVGQPESRSITKSTLVEEALQAKFRQNDQPRTGRGKTRW